MVVYDVDGEVEGTVHVIGKRSHKSLILTQSPRFSGTTVSLELYQHHHYHYHYHHHQPGCLVKPEPPP